MFSMGQRWTPCNEGVLNARPWERLPSKTSGLWWPPKLWDIKGVFHKAVKASSKLKETLKANFHDLLLQKMSNQCSRNNLTLAQRPPVTLLWYNSSEAFVVLGERLTGDYPLDFQKKKKKLLWHAYLFYFYTEEKWLEGPVESGQW